MGKHNVIPHLSSPSFVQTLVNMKFIIQIVYIHIVIIYHLHPHVNLVPHNSRSLTFRTNKDLAKQLCSPSPGSNEMHFATRFPQNGWGQFKACLWKQNLSYWRSPSYNLTRIIFMFCASLLFGILFWDQGNKMLVCKVLFMLV